MKAQKLLKISHNATTPVVACFITPSGGIYENPSLCNFNLDMYKITSITAPIFKEPQYFAKLRGY